MLMKLFKHEFRATGRIMGPVFLILLATSLGANLSLRVMLDSEYRVLNLLGGLLMMAFVFAIVAAFLVAFILMVQRFYKNLLQDEGYVMLTLPVSIHQHIWTKLTVSAVWFAATILVVILAACIAAFNISVISQLFEGLGDLMVELFHLKPSDISNIMLICAELLVLAFVSSCITCLQFYASLAIGHSAPSHKLAWSVAAYLVISFVMQLISGIGMIFLGEMRFWNLFPSWHLHMGLYGNIHLGLWIMIVIVAVYGAIYYPVTVWFMKHRLNLE